MELTRKDLDSGTVKLVELLKEIYQEEEDKEPELISEELYSKLNFEESYPSNSNSEKEEEKEIVFDQSAFKEDSESLENILDDKIVENRLNKDPGKRFTRSYRKSFVSGRVSTTLIKNNYFMGHNTAADLSMLKDFDHFKGEIDIVNKSMVTLKKPILLDGVNIFIRDTLLLAPGGSKALKTIGELYDLNKVEIGDKINIMGIFIKEDYKTFKRYAIQDARITLVHALFMEEFAFSLGLIGVPLSLSMLSSVYLRKFWSRTGYDGYQLSPEYLISNSASTQTPRGLFFVGDVGLKFSLYIANYKGGRNESFMYGVNDSFK